MNLDEINAKRRERGLAPVDDWYARNYVEQAHRMLRRWGLPPGPRWRYPLWWLRAWWDRRVELRKRKKERQG